MAVDINVANQALRHIGVRRISSIAEQSENARIIAECWQQVFDSVLEDGPWTFATRHEALIQLANEEAPDEWTYAFQFPVKCRKVLRVYEGDAITGNKIDYIEYTTENTCLRAIATNIETAYIEYTHGDPQSSVWSSRFKDALSWKLASEIAPTLKGDANLASQYLNNYRLIMTDAKRSDQNSEKRREERTSSYVEAR